MSTQRSEQDNNTQVAIDPENCPPEYFCEMCGHYPLIPVHGHFECTECKYKTKCCEGIAQ